MNIVLVISNHFVWFFYFTHQYVSIAEVASFFGLLVWLVPFSYFISLSANEYTLPAYGSTVNKGRSSNLNVGESSDPFTTKSTRKRLNLIKSFISSILEELRVYVPISTTKKS